MIFKEKKTFDALNEQQRRLDLFLTHASHSRFQEAFDFNLPVKGMLSCENGAVKISRQEGLPKELQTQIDRQIKQMIPWRKGPFDIYGHPIDAEWRSELKWERIAPYLPPMRGKRVLDVGCNNGYYLFRAATLGFEYGVGIDPFIPYYAQFQFLKNLTAYDNIEMALIGLEDLAEEKELFDFIFYMGIIYHHKNPIEHLLILRQLLRPGGEVILETIGIAGEESTALFPEDRYANMRNVWFVPTLSCFINWVKKAQFFDIEVISVTELTKEEQRLSSHCPPPNQTLEHFLDPNDKTKTVEGHMAPLRFAIKARKK